MHKSFSALNKLLIAVLALAATANAADVEWARFKGMVKTVNLKEQTITLLNREGDIWTFPIDYQVKIIDKKDVIHTLQDTELGSTVTLLKVISEKPKDDTAGLEPYRGMDPSATTEPDSKRRSK